MSARSLLRSQLRSAWRRTMRGPYSGRQINSERGLQVHFCISLLTEFTKSAVGRHLFVEPVVLFPDATKRYPDLVICNARRVIGVIEFKYTPRARPIVGKDMNTLHRFASSGKSVVLANDRFRGIAEAKQYSVAPDAVLCWAAVYAGNLAELPARALSSIGSRFVRLDAITRDGDEVEIP